MKKIVLIGLMIGLQGLLAGCGDDLDQYGYQYSGASCVSRYNGQAVDPSKCVNSPYATNNGVLGNTVAGGYYINAGNCYTQTGQVVAMTYCSQVGGYVNNGLNNGYYINAGNCYSPQGQIVPLGYCQQGTTGVLGTAIAQQCVGTYYVQGAVVGGQTIACNGANCRGQILMTLQGQQVQCQ